jgi:hypothetical protein
MYHRLPYVSIGALPFNTLVLYIYRPRGTMQYNQPLYTIYSSNNIALETVNSVTCWLNEVAKDHVDCIIE